MDPMNPRVVALGHSSAGRSSYLAAMYTHLAADRRGFRLVTADRRTADELTSTGRRLRKGLHPPPSSRRTEPAAVLRYGRGEVLGFHRTDDRGGALTGSAADAHRLAADPDSHEEVRRTVALPHRAVTEQRTPLPVVLAHTKADLVTGPADWRRARAAMAPLGEPAAGGGRVRGRTVAVSCGPGPRGTAPPAGAPARAVAR
ncbi:hypothetical protein [Kitasatospora purpeofusca]|uniref:hypothetical protein n=1 Tax=Kitasatospora purpeofusca TaxID=67352 RepID=UPI0036D27CE0